MKAPVRLSLLAAFVLIFAGCGDKARDLAVSKAQDFGNSSTELKQAWEKALEADKTNDYVMTETLLYWLTRQTLTADQRQAVDNQLTAVNQRLSDAVQKGDPAARTALQELRSNPPGRQR